MNPQETRSHKEIDEDFVVIPYDIAWPALYERESEALRSIPDISGIEHFGSTAVPGLSAKPIVDILVGISEFNLSKNQQRCLVAMNYEGFGEQGVPGRFHFRKRGSAAFNLAVTLLHGPLWNDNILLRDYLRSHPQVAREYGEQKRHAIASGANRLLSYSESKAAFVAALMAKARNWRCEHA